MKNNWKKLISLLNGHTVWLQSHNFPDPDSIASTFGLQYFLRHHGIESKICYDGDAGSASVQKMFKAFHITIYHITEISPQESDYVVLVDGQKFNSNMTDILGKEVACIDHHPTVKECDEYLYRDLRITGACASIITEYLKESATPLNKEVASALFYGIKMDTDSFNRGVTKLDIEAFHYLYDHTDINLVNNMYSNNLTESDLRAFGSAIKNIRIDSTLGIANIDFECETPLIAKIADFILTLEEILVAVVYAKQSNGIRVSVRSEDASVHAGNLIKKALKQVGDGGGHQCMAGGFISRQENLTDEKITTLFLSALSEQKN